MKYQQGDVVLTKISINEIMDRMNVENGQFFKFRGIGQWGKYNPNITNFTKKSSENRAIVALGEVTGHAHAIYLEDLLESAGVKLYSSGNRPDPSLGDVPDYIEVLNDPVVLKHEEHKPLTIPKGAYRVNIVREFDHLTNNIRNVAD